MGIRPHHGEPPLRQVDSEPYHPRPLFKSGMWQKLHSFFARDDPTRSPVECLEDGQWPQPWPGPDDDNKQDPSSRPLAIGLPRQATFKRQNSERRDRLLPIEPCPAERRAVSSTRHASTSRPRPRATSSPPHWDPARLSAPALAVTSRADHGVAGFGGDAIPSPLDSSLPSNSQLIWPSDAYRAPRPPSTTSSDSSHYPRMDLVDDSVDLRNELDSRWILNLSMHFRDKSDREKFFVTYAETPSRWRRVTISCDYRNAEPGSLEMDLKELQFQRDKSIQIYESIRDSLPEIQFYETVTNLKLETTEGRLHVHVTEDVNEIIPYPPRNTVAHILGDEEFCPMEVCEGDLVFDSHLSGFVYKVQHQDKVYIKKEIPGPDTVDEFLYEINALHALHGSKHVIQLEAIVLDDTRQSVKGLLIGFAEKGAIVDLLYDHRGSIPWEDRCRWAEQAVRGLSEIHEEGYVQGDFTLSNIVADGDGNAKIIDINRRGCPVGWEPPEIATKIASNQRISMYIGEKSDLYQLGMTLWALAMDDDEPERHVPPLSVEEFPSEVPEWYQDIVRTCLSQRPRDRLSAKALAELFPDPTLRSSEPPVQLERPALKLRTLKEYINPADAVERDDIERLISSQHETEHALYSPESSRDDYTFTYPKSSNYEFDSETSAYDRPRGRAPPTNFSHLGRNERHHWTPNCERSVSAHDAEPNIVAISPGRDREFDEVDLDGHPYLISRKTFNDEELEILERMVEAGKDISTGDLPMDEVTPDATEDRESSSPPPARGRPLLAAVCTTSDSTPRNSHAMLPTLARHLPACQSSESGDDNDTDLMASDAKIDAGMSQREASGTSKAATGDTNLDPPTGNATESIIERLPLAGPPSLPYADSGYDEPLGMVDDDAFSDTKFTTINLTEEGQTVVEAAAFPVRPATPNDARHPEETPDIQQVEISASLKEPTELVESPGITEPDGNHLDTLELPNEKHSNSDIGQL